MSSLKTLGVTFVFFNISEVLNCYNSLTLGYGPNNPKARVLSVALAYGASYPMIKANGVTFLIF